MTKELETKYMTRQKTPRGVNLTKLQMPRDVIVVMNLVTYTIPKNLVIPLDKNSDILKLDVTTHIHPDNEKLTYYLKKSEPCDIITNTPALKNLGFRRVVDSKRLIDSQKIDLVGDSIVIVGKRIVPTERDLIVLKAVINEAYLQNKVIPADRERYT